MKKLLLIVLIPVLLWSCSPLWQNTLPDKEQTSINTITESPQDTMMREHCKMMPEMAGCEKYKNNTPSKDSTDGN